ncbi:UNVERIFIED_CONTAM: hypothetical protein Sindi_0938700 [Sesamum indicum]
MALALVVITRRLRPYFLSHPIEVKTNLPLKQILGKLDTSGRSVNWAVEFIEYDISYLPRTTIKAQTLANFVYETVGTYEEGIPQAEKWLLHVDRSSTTQDSGAGIILISLQREDLEFAIKFRFKASNNEVEYEAFVTRLKMTHEVRARHVIVYSDSQYPISYKAKEENMK